MKNKNSNFCHLHLHTDKGSLLDGLGKASEYAERAKELGFKYMGITDHGSIDCCIDFQNECLKRDIIPIIGCELYLVSSGDFKGKSGHCCVFIENETGWRNLCEILSIANLEHFYRKPRVDFDILYEKCEGLVITTACAGSWLKLEGAEKFLKKLHKKVGNNNIFLEIMPHNLEVQHEVNDMCLRLHKETGIQLITTTDAHYVKDEDHKIHDVLLAIQTKTTMDNPNRFRFNFDGAHMQTWEEILENYEKIGKIDKLTVKKSLFNTNKIAEKCKDFRIKKREISLPDCNPFPEMDSKKALKKLYTQKAKDRLDIDLNDPIHKEYKDRIEMEYKVICDKNFQMYFLIVCDFIDWCKNQGFIVGPARGCLTNDTIVLTDNGYKPLSSLSAGDNVVSHSGTYNKILNKMKYEVKDENLLKISSFFGYGGDAMTRDHKVLSIKRGIDERYRGNKKNKKYKEFKNNDLSWNEASSLKIGDLMFTPWITNRKIKDIEYFDLSKYFKKYDDEYCYYNVRNKNIDSDLTIRGLYRLTGISRNAIQSLKYGRQKTSDKTKQGIISALRKKNISLSDWKNLNGQNEIRVKRFIKNDKKFLNLIGRWIGDGWISNPGKYRGQTYSKFGLCFCSDEKEDMNYYRDYINSLGFEIAEKKQKGKKLIQWHVYCDGFAKFFADIFSNYKKTSSTKYIPMDFKLLPDHKLKEIIVGLEGADGHVSKASNREWIDTTSKTLKDDIKEVLLYLKIPSSIYKRDPFYAGKYLCNTSWKITFSGIKLQKKDQEGLSTKNPLGYYSRIYKIEEVRDVDYVYDIEVENDNSYLTQNYIVHNSAAGSYLSYVLGITEIDPIKHDLIFERFLNPERDSYPDIDIDIPDNKRAEARQYLIKKYGENHIAGISTFSYLKGKSVIRDVSRVFNIPLDEVDVFAKSLEDKGTEIVKSGKETEEGKSFYKKYPEIVDIAIKLEGTVRGKGQHAAGIVVSSQDLTVSGQCNLMSMGKKGEKQNVVNWNLDNAEYLGLMKLDLLGLSQLSIIGESFYLIQKNENKKLNIRDFLDVSDQNIFSSLSRGHTAGVFQMNTRTMTSYIKKLGINNFEDISACLALVRPGAADSGVADEYLLRNSGKQWDKKHTIYEDITKETLGLICYQEQSMFMFTRMAGLPFSVADSIRKIIGKKRDVREFDRYKDMFIEGCLKEKTMTKDEALQFWTELEASANYSFNKSHSVSYAYLSYITAWLKYYYQAYFYSANLTCGSSDKKAQIVKEAYDHGLDLKLPKVGFSDAHKWAVNDGTLIAPFSEIKGLGHSHAIEAAQEKKKQFKQASFYVTKERQENETKIRKLLTMVDAWDYNGKPSEYMQEYFDFPISNDVSVIAPTLLKMCKKYYTQEEIYKIYKGKKYPSKLNLIKKYKKPEETNFTCKGCSIQMRPYPTNFGDKTLMIITEHPSYWDNDKGKLLSCDTSNELLMKLFEMNIYYEDITVATGVKCYPGKGNKPADEHRRTCWVHLMDEIEKAKPKIILSLGKACEFFDSEYKISEKAGTFEWSEKHKTFIFYAYSFGYASIDQDKRDKYNMSIKKFVKTIEKVVNN